MKRSIIMIITLLIMAIMVVGAVGCTKMEADEGIAYLKEAYANSLRDGDIYQFTEKVYSKATVDKEGYIINRKVNVNCAVNNKYELIKDKDYAIDVHEDMYSESVDGSSKISSNMISYNDIKVGKTRPESDKNTTLDALFVGTGSLDANKKMQTNGFVQRDVNAKDFYNSDYFAMCQLANKQIMREIGLIIERPEDINFDIKDGGIERKGKTCDFTFKVSDKYLEDFKKEYGVPSLFDGKYVWVQVSYDRISNVFVYGQEDLGSSALSVEYEKYMFMITYLGPKVGMNKFPDKGETKGYEIVTNIYDKEANTFDSSILAKIN